MSEANKDQNPLPRSVVLNSDGYRFLGINVLTGEACRLGQRLLCDLTEDAKGLVQQYFGAEMKFDKNNNSMVGDEPAVASVMMGRDTLREIAVFGMMVKNCLAIIEPDKKTGFNRIAIFDQALLGQYQRSNQEQFDNAAKVGISPADFYKSPSLTEGLYSIRLNNIHRSDLQNEAPAKKAGSPSMG